MEQPVIDRRSLLRRSAATCASASTTVAPRVAAAQPARRARMYLGHQHDHSEDTVRALAAFGVPEICGGQFSPRSDETWSVDMNFRETFPNNGDVDMLRALRTYHEVGSQGMIMPDHVPTIEGDTERQRAFAYAFGYIQALLKVVNTA